jgi:hypothetical protein
MAATGTNLLKRMKLSGTRRSKQLVPGVGAESGYAGKTSLNVTELDGADKPGEVGAEGSYRCIGIRILVNADNQEDRSARQRTDHQLRKNDLV